MSTIRKCGTKYLSKEYRLTYPTERIVESPLPTNKEKIVFKTNIKPKYTPAYIPERIEEIHAPNLEITPDPDLFNDLGSLLATTRKPTKNKN